MGHSCFDTRLRYNFAVAAHPETNQVRGKSAFYFQGKRLLRFEVAPGEAASIAHIPESVDLGRQIAGGDVGISVIHSIDGQASQVPGVDVAGDTGDLPAEGACSIEGVRRRNRRRDRAASRAVPGRGRAGWRARGGTADNGCVRASWRTRGSVADDGRVRASWCARGGWHGGWHERRKIGTGDDRLRDAGTLPRNGYIVPARCLLLQHLDIVLLPCGQVDGRRPL